MTAIRGMIAVLATAAVLVGGPAWAGDEAKGSEALQVAAEVRSGTIHAPGDLAFSPVVQRALAVGPDHRGAISFETGSTRSWPRASWIRTPRSEEIEAKVKRWLKRPFPVDASGDERRGLVGHGMVAAEMNRAFVDVTPQMIVEATRNLDPESHELPPTVKPAEFPFVVAFRTSGGTLGVLEIRDFSHGRKLVRFRYKLVRPDESAEEPATAPPAAVLAEFLWQLEVMRFATQWVAAGEPPAPSAAEKVERATFQSLAIEMSDHWMGRRTIVIQGDGKYTFDLKDYTAAYQLKPEHLRRLEELLEAADWLTTSIGRQVPIVDATVYTLTLDREGRKTTIAVNDIQQDSYKELIRFIRRIERQEILLYQATIPEQKNHVAYELKSELDGLAEKPVAMPYAPVLDYHRLVPVFAEWLAKPQGRSDDAIAAAAELMAFLKIESQRPSLEAIARGHVPDQPEYESSDAARIAVVRALGRLGSGTSLSVLESLEAHSDPFVRAAVAEALVSAPAAEAIPILKQMTAETRPAAWALIRLGDKAESAIIEILEEPTFRSSGPDYLIREYYEHWKELPSRPSAAIVAAIYDRVQAEAGRGGPDRYGLDVLKLAGDPFVVRNAWQDLQEALSLMATKGRERRKKLLLGTRLHRPDRVPEAFLEDAEAGKLAIRRVMADRTSALAYLDDQQGEVKYVLWLNRIGVVWSIGSVWTVPGDNVQARVDHFRESHPQAKEVRADDPLPE